MASKVFFVTNDLFSLFNFRGDLIKSLASNGFQVFAAVPFIDNNLVKRYDLPVSLIEYKISRSFVSPFTFIKELFGLYRLFKKFSPDFVVSYFQKPVVLSNLVSIFFKDIYSISMIEGMGVSRSYIYSNPLFKFLYNFIYWVSLKGCDDLFFNNSHDLTYFLDNKLFNRYHLHLLGGIGVDTSHWQCSRFIKDPNSKINFIMISRLLRSKGVFEFCTAAKYISSFYPNAYFSIVGDIDDSNPDSLSISDLSLIKSNYPVDLLGFSHDVHSLLASADVFVLPTFYGEGMPRVIQEAMSMSMPIITTNIDGASESVMYGVNGYTIPIRDPWSLSSACIQYLEDPKLIVSHGSASRRMAEILLDSKIKSSLFLSLIKK